MVEATDLINNSLYKDRFLGREGEFNVRNLGWGKHMWVKYVACVCVCLGEGAMCMVNWAV